MRLTFSTRATRVATAVAALPLVALGVASPAAAEQTVHDDPAGDVIERETVPDYSEQVVPGDRKRDITSIKTTYADHKLVVTIDLRNLGTDYNLYTRITTSAGGHFIVANYDEAGTSEDTIGLYAVPTPRQAARGGGIPVECPGLDVVRLLDKDRIRTIVPRSCLDAPASVRTGTLMHAFYDEGHARMDDARRDADVEPVDIGKTRLGSSVSYN